ncbi:MAG: hypothetical protein RSE94_11725 [Pseudomonas sp.]
MTPDDLTRYAVNSGIKTDSPVFKALQLRYLEQRSYDSSASLAGVAKQTVRNAVAKIEWTRSAQPNGLLADKPAAAAPPAGKMTPAQFAAVAELTGVSEGSKTYRALLAHHVDGRTQAASALIAGIHVGTMNNAMRRIELTQARLPTLHATVLAAMGSGEKQ